MAHVATPYGSRLRRSDRVPDLVTMTVDARHSLEAAVSRARERYTQRRPVAAAMDAEARRVMPGGNTRTVLYHPPFPLRVARGWGSRIIDVDGFEYVDLLGEYTAGLYGHSNDTILSAVREVLDHGLSLGAHNTYEARFAAAITERFPSIQLIRFTNSGTEANLMAVSLARVVTERPDIAVAVGGYHGGLMYFGGGGSPINAPFGTVLLHYNDIDQSRSALRSHGDSLAAIVIEGVQGSAGCIPADREYLQVLRDEATDLGIAFIADEVMTSRLAPHGYCAELGITPDLITLGKYLGGGFSFGAFGGRADWMARFDPRSPDALPHAGTFNNNVATMAAGLAGITEVLDDAVIIDLNERGDHLRRRLHEVVQPYGWCASGQGSMIGLHPVPGPVRSTADLAPANPHVRELLFLELLERGWYIAARGFIALSIDITDDDVDNFIEAIVDIFTVTPELHTGFTT
jgi:glutamate-1-semialdehyde 2,1-aminomutase